MIKAVFLDCWGTILTAPELMKRGATTQHFHRILTSHGHVLDYEEFRNSYSVVTRRQNQIYNVNWKEFDHEERLRETLEAIRFQHPDLSGVVHMLWEEYLKEWPLQSTPYQETMPLLEHLKGKYKLGLITNFARARILMSNENHPELDGFIKLCDAACRIFSRLSLSLSPQVKISG